MAASRDYAEELIARMHDKNWKRVKDLFHEAQQYNSGRRKVFLDAECAGDNDLRDEVESLLMSLAEAEKFLEKPVIGDSGDKAIWQFQNGRRISHYRIVEPIGSGGMGEVYLADDERLGRQVALKILPQDMLRDRSRLARFEREARTVSALNHPNILTIYDFEEEDGISLFASEFVKGMTLRDRLDRGGLTIVETLDIAIQITSALQAAHEAGVVHRDIKPENVMIREDGYVKVVDFGLAKLTEKIESGEIDRTLTQSFSLPGMIMGTVTYMSPEQARGKPVDERSDIFSLGIVLFEMLTGQPPFVGETATDVIAGIIRSDPPPVTSITNNVPAEVDGIIRQALSKDPNDRFQNARSLQAHLKELVKRLEFDAALERAGRPASQSELVKATSVKGIALNSSDRKRSSIRSDLPPLVGREAEIAELTDLIMARGVRLVSLTGIGGTGKTRLAQEICRRLEDKFIDGFVFVRLSELRDSSLIAAIIAQEAGVPETIGNPIAESLKDYLQDKQMLLVLDNFEQIMEAGPFVAELIASTMELTILVTSRERLNIQAEVEFNVPPLATPEDAGFASIQELAGFDSIRLFVERSQQANPEFELTEENGEQIARICSMLDGLPLAIELAAARTRIFSPASIVERLEARLAFLTGGARDLPERQRTMRATVEWSYELLNEDEKRLFRRLSVFPCQFSPAAAERVTSQTQTDLALPEPAYCETVLESVEFLDLFASLADKNLLVRRQRPQGDTKYGLLEIVREYAEGVLDGEDDADAIRLRHARLYLALAESAGPHLQSRESGVWMGRLEEEHENLRSALRWSIKKEPLIAARIAAAIGHFWVIRGHLSEGMKWAREILDQDIEVPPEIIWKILTVCGNISQFQGDIASALDFYERCLDAARRSGNQADIARSLRGVGALAYMKYDFATARTLLNEALSISRDCGDDFGLAAARARLGDIANVEGDLSTAYELTSKALATFRQIGYLEGISAKLYNLGAIVFLDGDHEAAQRYFEEAHTTALELGEKINTRLIFDGFAALAAEKGEYCRAARLSGVAEGLGATIGYSAEPAEKIFRDAYVGKLRSAMTEEEFSAESEIGRKLTMEQMRELIRPRHRAELKIKGSGSGSKVPVHVASSANTSLNDVESLSGVFARAARYQNVVLAVLLSILLMASAVMLALWIWGAK